MSDAVVAPSDEPATPIRLVAAAQAEARWSRRCPVRCAARQGWPASAARRARSLTLAGEGGPELVLAGLGAGSGAMALRALPARLPAGLYALEPRDAGPAPADAALAFALGAYRFDRYKQGPRRGRRQAGLPPTASTSPSCAPSPTPARWPAT